MVQLCLSSSVSGGRRPGEERARFHAAYVSGFTKCCSFSHNFRPPPLKSPHVFSPSPSPSLPLSLCLPEINFAESLAKMSGWFLGRGGGEKNWQPRLSTPPSFLFLFHLSFVLSVALSLSARPLCLELPLVSFSGKFAFTAGWRKTTAAK